MNYLPGKLVKLRKHYNYSQSYVAEFLGMDTFDYMAYENGSKMIDYAKARKLAVLFHIPVIQIFMNNEDVDLHEVTNTTDELNIKFFEKELSFKEKVKTYIVQHKIVTGIIFVLTATIVVLLVALMNMSKDYKPHIDSGNRLSCSNTTVLYIDEDGRVLGSGSNTNGELSNLRYTNAIKVCEGEGFSIILNEDGTIDHSGLTESMAKEVDSLKNIIDIAAGDSHILAADRNGKAYCIGNEKACSLVKSTNTKRVYATANGSILEDEYGYLTYSGSFIGSSSIKSYNNIVTLDSSDTVLAIVNNNNTINVYSNNGENYFIAESWKDIVDVACGNDFVAGLDKYGKVHIEITNDDIELEVSNWSNIIAISSGDDYLIGFDGNQIYGVGNNKYNQFVKEVITKQTLEKVNNVSYSILEDEITIQFDGVKNASAYKISLNVLTGLSKRVESEQIVSFDTTNMTEGKTYTISIVSIGTGDYKDSDVYELSFVYRKPIEVNEDME